MGREGEVKVVVPVVLNEDNKVPFICAFRVGTV